MSVATAPTISPTQPGRADSTARQLVLLVFVLVAVLVAALFVASLLPAATLTGRLLGAAGESRSGSFTQDLVANLGQRMRLASALLLAVLVGLFVLRTSFEEMLQAVLAAGRWKVRMPERLDALAVAASIVLAVGLRAAFLNQPMRYDEALTYNEFASRPLYYALSFYPDPNNHLLNTLLVHVVSGVLGSEPWVLRLPAFLAGVLLVPATYGLARLLYGTGAAFAAAVLVACSSYIVEYSTNSRGYTLQALAFVTTFSLAIVALRRGSPAALLLATLVAAAGTYALPTMFYGVVLVAAWLVLEMRRADPSRLGVRHVAVSGLLLGLIVLLTYLPVLLVSGADKLVSNRFVAPLDLTDLAAELPVSLARTWGLWNRDLPLALSVALVIGFTIACFGEARRRWVPLGLLAPVVCLGIVLLQRVAPFERVWLFLLPLYLSIAVGGLSAVVRSRLTLSFAACLVAMYLAIVTLRSGTILASTETGTFPDAQAVSHALQGVLDSDDAVLTTIPASLPELQYYFPREGLRIASLVRSPAEAHNLFVIAAPGATPGVAGWRDPRELARFSGSVLLKFSRAAS